MTIKRRVRKVVCTVVTKIKMNRFIFIFLVVISLGISVFYIRYTKGKLKMKDGVLMYNDKKVSVTIIFL